jgi:hypothetical protein
VTSLKSLTYLIFILVPLLGTVLLICWIAVHPTWGGRLLGLLCLHIKRKGPPGTKQINILFLGKCLIKALLPNLASAAAVLSSKAILDNFD